MYLYYMYFLIDAIVNHNKKIDKKLSTHKKNISMSTEIRLKDLYKYINLLKTFKNINIELK